MDEILFVAGETSGDVNAAGVAHELRARGLPYRLAGVGGDAMRAAGVELVEHAGGLATMGFIEPLKKLGRYRALLRRLSSRMAERRTALVILVDFGGFNLRVAAAAAAAGVPVLYFITPQVWASRAGRLRSLAASVTRAAVILPFEEDLLRAHGVDARFVGHPVLDRAAEAPTREAARRDLGIGEHERLLVLFPGSRPQEVERHLDPFVAAARELQRRDPSLRVLVSAAPHVRIPDTRCPYPRLPGSSLTLLRAADAAMCKSGTTTLEAAVMGCPLVVCYRTDALTYAIARRVVKIRFIGMVNLLAGREIAREFIQGALQPGAVADALAPLLDARSPERDAALQALAEVRASLGAPGAAGRVADMAVEMLPASPAAHVRLG